MNWNWPLPKVSLNPPRTLGHALPATGEVELVPIQSETVSPAAFLRKARAGLDNVESYEIVAPRIGSKGFGHVIVTYRSPVFQMGDSRRHG